MVTQVTGMSRNGVSDWIIQRVSAVVLALYTLCVVGFVLMNPELDYAAWSAYFNHTAMKVFTMLAIIATCAHAWIGMWTIGSDYLQSHLIGSSATVLRAVYQIGCVLLIFAYLLWGINIVWGN